MMSSGAFSALATSSATGTPPLGNAKTKTSLRFAYSASLLASNCPAWERSRNWLTKGNIPDGGPPLCRGPEIKLPRYPCVHKAEFRFWKLGSTAGACRPLLNRVPAIDHEVRAIHHVAGIGREKEGRGGDFFRIRETTSR